MRNPLHRPRDGRGAQKKVESDGKGDKETDPLLSSSSPSFVVYDGRTGRRPSESTRGSVRARRASRSPQTTTEHKMERIPDTPQSDHDDRFYHATDSYTLHTDNESATTRSQMTGDERGLFSGRTSTSTDNNHRQQYQEQRGQNYYMPTQTENPAEKDRNLPNQPPLLEIPEEIYAVRKSALQVLKPLTSSWLVASIGFSLTVLLAMARWTRLLPDLPYWFVLLPSWGSHVGLLWCHIKSARALSNFISEANENRQRPDSTDYIDRTEYLPLLQRSLKFGLKTGILSFCSFLFEILLYIRLAKGTISLAVCFIPLWLLVSGGILDGIICKTQHFLRIVCWTLIFVSMVLAVLRVDERMDMIKWRMIVSPIVAVLSISSAALIYIVYGHQVGYYRLTESQLTAGILYSMSVLICIVLVVVISEVMPLSRPVEIETRVFVVVMAPLVVSLTGMGAYAVSRDEFGRLLLYGGQAAVHPMKLRWESNGWTSVPTKGVTVLPMFGEVSYRPLEKKSKANSIELCSCCTCYPYEEEDEVVVQNAETDDWRDHPYLAPSPSTTSYFRRSGLGNFANNA